MHAKAFALLVLAIFFIGLIVPFQTVGADRALGKLDPTLVDRLEGAQQPGMRVQGSSVFVFVGLNSGYAARDVAGYMSAKFEVGPSHSPFAVYGTTDVASLLDLASSPAVSYIFPDVKLGFEQMKPDPEVYSQHLATDMFKVRQIIGADQVNQLGISGNNVTVAVVDTGTDFTIPDLAERGCKKQFRPSDFVRS